MDHIIHIERGDSEESKDLQIAHAISQALCKAYPNHYWLVSFTGHALIVRHVFISSIVAMQTGKEGFGSLLPRDKLGTVHEATREAIKHGGALLEAFGLKRGPYTGDEMPVMPADLKREILSRRPLRGWR